MNKAVIFDLDGTLLHTIPDITDNINLMLDKFGYARVSESDVRRFVGCGARNLVKKCLPADTTEQQLDERLAYYNEIYTACGSPKTALFEGIDQVLREIKARGYKIAILTNKPQQTTDRVYCEYLSEFVFDAVVGQSGTVKCKPNPKATFDILSELGVQPQDAYFVGDGETDVETAKNAGTKSIAVLWGYRDKEQLEKVGATVFASTPKDLLKLIP